ncbi:MAG: reverse transcriptase family protein, partial [Cyanobacteria bacterium J06649_11]
FGFRKGKSTEQAINYVLYSIEKWKAKKIDVALILLDFSKAFDLIDHEILLDKLTKFGFTYKAKKLIASYLENRRMAVRVNGKTSVEKWIGPAGCPQGSCLGPLLYLIYTADLISCLQDTTLGESLDISIFADDTSIVVPNPTKENLREILSKAEKYASNNKLKLNMAKTELVCTKDLGSITVTNQKIEIHNQASSVKYLCVYLNLKGTWDDHMKEIKRKMMAGIRALYKIRGAAPKKVLINIYNCLVKSHLTYAMSSWGGTLTNGQLYELEKVQNLAVRCFENLSGPIHFTNIKKAHGILKPKELAISSVVNYLLTATSRSNKLSPLQAHFKVQETKTRQQLSVLPLYKGPTLKYHAKIARVYHLNWNLELKQNTIMKRVNYSLLEDYKSGCEKDNCYVCLNMQNQKKRQEQIIVEIT